MKNLKDKDLHNIQLKDIRLVHANAQMENLIDKIDSRKVSIETKIANYGEVISDNEGRAYLKTVVKGIIEKTVIFEIQVTYEGICITNEQISKQEFEFYLEVQAVPMLWSYIRETINTITLKMGLKPILLPTLNITQLINDMKKNKGGDGREL